MSVRPDLPALHLLNSVFAGVTGHDLYLAEQLKAGIDSALAAGGAVAGGAADFAAAVAALQGRLGDSRPGHGFYHWDATQSPADPDSLWSRQQIVDALKRLAPYAEGTLLITGLRAALCPHGRRWSRRRRAAYANALAFLGDLAAARKRPSADLRVFVM